MVLKLFTTFIVVAAISASPKHRDFTWSYRSSIYRVHWFYLVYYSDVISRQNKKFKLKYLINKTLQRKSTIELVLQF